MDSKQAFENMVPNIVARVAFEDSVLSCGREFLPPEALQVLDGGEATDAYWAFLCDQGVRSCPPPN